jgi:hypothetical protein
MLSSGAEIALLTQINTLLASEVNIVFLLNKSSHENPDHLFNVIQLIKLTNNLTACGI